MKCGKCKTEDVNKAHVRACYGLPAEDQPLRIDVSGELERERLAFKAAFAEREAEQERQAYLGKMARDEALMRQPIQPVNERQPKPDWRDLEPKDTQLSYLGDLLRQRNIVAETGVIAALTRGTISTLIDDLKAWKPGQPLWSGLRVATPTATESGVRRATTYPEVPEGHYAVPSATGNNDLDFYRVDHPVKDGITQTYVKRIIGGHPDTNIRRSMYFDVLKSIAHYGIQKSAVLYGQQIGACRHCNRSLTVLASRWSGVGATCAAKHGDPYSDPPAGWVAPTRYEREGIEREDY